MTPKREKDDQGSKDPIKIRNLEVNKKNGVQKREENISNSEKSLKDGKKNASEDQTCLACNKKLKNVIQQINKNIQSCSFKVL